MILKKDAVLARYRFCYNNLYKQDCQPQYMNNPQTKTKVGFKEPESPIKTAIDADDSTRVDVCVLDRTNSNHEGVVIYIRNPRVDIENFLDRVKDLESGFFPESPKEVRNKIRDTITQIPFIDEERQKDRYYVLQYGWSGKEEIYEAIRALWKLFFGHYTLKSILIYIFIYKC